MKRISIIVGAFLLLASGLTFKAEAQVNAPIPFKAAALTNTAVVVKALPGRTAWLVCSNANAANEFVQFYDTVSAVSVGTTAPTVSIPVPVGAVTQEVPAQFFTGIKIAATTTYAGASAPGVALDCSVGFN